MKTQAPHQTSKYALFKKASEQACSCSGRFKTSFNSFHWLGFLASHISLVSLVSPVSLGSPHNCLMKLDPIKTK